VWSARSCGGGVVVVGVGVGGERVVRGTGLKRARGTGLRNRGVVCVKGVQGRRVDTGAPTCGVWHSPGMAPPQPTKPLGRHGQTMVRTTAASCAIPGSTLVTPAHHCSHAHRPSPSLSAPPPSPPPPHTPTHLQHRALCNPQAGRLRQHRPKHLGVGQPALQRRHAGKAAAAQRHAAGVLRGGARSREGMEGNKHTGQRCGWKKQRVDCRSPGSTIQGVGCHPQGAGGWRPSSQQGGE
jgi:hypothetical protein